MPDFPRALVEQNQISIGSFSPESIGLELMSTGVTASTSFAWPTANLALYIPVEVYTPILIAKMSINNGATVSGNVDVGIYDVGGAKLVTMGSTAQSGVSAIQTFDIADTLLLPGLYYMALAIDNTTSTIAGWTGAIAIECEAMGVFQQASAFALPSPATYAANTQTVMPLISMTPKTTI